MSQILEATKTNAKDAALVAFGVPVVLFDRVSGRLNARLHLDSYVGLAREHGERALDGYGKQLHDVTRGIRCMMRRPVSRAEGPLGPAPRSEESPEPAPRSEESPEPAPRSEGPLGPAPRSEGPLGPRATAAASTRTSSTSSKKRAPRAKSSR